VLEKLVPDDKSNAGKEVNAVQLNQEYPKLVPLDKSSAEGREVSAVHPYHAAKKLVPEDRSSAGKEVRAVQPYHV
tara:strand:- start:185 stop:409 length:225 start_codon:yes stop_codon:yes gene_type:complete